MEIKCKECNKKMEVYNKYNHKLKMEMGHVELFRFDIPIHMYFDGDDKNNEYTLCLCEECGNKIYSLDCYFKVFNIDIEFNGDIFHGNPRLFKEDDKCNPFEPDLTVGEMWKSDENRKNQLKKYHDIDILVIWEYDYCKNEEWTIENFVDNTLVPLLRKKKENK